MINLFSESDIEKLLNKKVKVTFFDKKVKIGILEIKEYYEFNYKPCFVVDGQPFLAEYVNNIEEVEE